MLKLQNTKGSCLSVFKQWNESWNACWLWEGIAVNCAPGAQARFEQVLTNRGQVLAGAQPEAISISSNSYIQNLDLIAHI